MKKILLVLLVSILLPLNVAAKEYVQPGTKLKLTIADEWKEVETNSWQNECGYIYYDEVDMYHELSSKYRRSEMNGDNLINKQFELAYVENISKSTLKPVGYEIKRDKIKYITIWGTYKGSYYNMFSGINNGYRYTVSYFGKEDKKCLDKFNLIKKTTTSTVKNESYALREWMPYAIVVVLVIVGGTISTAIEKNKKLKTATDIANEKGEEPQVRKMTVKSNRKED